ncbi:MAG: hypothetical protein H6R01_949 [Burkholderiaceae bacterium]|nr:hypothetical protein [Burkholderiaceae bacterium]
MLKKRLDFGLEIKSVNDAGEFSGYGSVFDVKDSYGDIVVRGAFENSLTDWKTKGRMPALLWQHDTREPIGVYTRMEEDDRGLYLEGKLLIDADPVAKRAHAHLKAGSISGLSIGYSLPDTGFTWDKDKKAFILKEINLWEVSLVTFPANDSARIETVKAAFSAGETPDIRTLEAFLRDAGFSAKQAKAFLSQGYKALNHRDGAQELMEALKTRNFTQ